MNNTRLPSPATQRNCMSAAMKRYKYFRRMLKFDQMDFEFAFWQMLYLFISPPKVFKNFTYRKQTKSQFARDDPAFLILFAAWLCITSIGFSMVLALSFGQFIGFLFYRIFVDCIGVSILVATIFWYESKKQDSTFLPLGVQRSEVQQLRFLLNRYFRIENEIQDVEWAYCFDVHLNAFFPPLMLLDFFQLFFYNSVIRHGFFISILLGNTFWLVALLYYMYITFLGYKSLSFLYRTHLIASPLPLIILLYLFSLAGGINITRDLVIFYKLFI